MAKAHKHQGMIAKSATHRRASKLLILGRAKFWRGTAVASGGIAEAVVGKSIQSRESTEGCLTRPDGKAVVNSCGTLVGAHGTLCRALGPDKENNDAMESPKGYILSGCSELKGKFWLIPPLRSPICDFTGNEETHEEKFADVGIMRFAVTFHFGKLFFMCFL